MGRRVYLHVGTMKSATTYLQGLCDENPGLLADRGILWQGAGANFGAVQDLFDSASVDRHAQWKSFARAIRRHDGDALVSNELLSMRGPRKIHAIAKRLAPAELNVIVTARDLGRVLPSQWQERARNRATGSWSDFMAALAAPGSRDDDELAWFWQRQDLGWIVSNWAAEVGVDHVTVVTVPPAGADFRLVAERFFAVLGIDPLPELVEPGGQNPALGAHSIELVRRVHERLDDVERERIHASLKHILGRRVLAARRSHEPALQLDPGQLAWARSQARRTIAELEATGVRVVGDLNDLVPTGDGEADAADPGQTPNADLLAAALDAVIGLTAAVDDLAREVDPERHGEVLRRLSSGDPDEAGR